MSSNKTSVAVGVSVAIQMFYHLYQGMLSSMVFLMPMFLAFSLYYVRRRRVTPVIVAHLFFDLVGLVQYSK